MNVKLKPLRGPLVLLVGLALFLGGCSELGSPDMGTAATPDSPQTMEAPPFNLTHYQYPEAANYPPQGYQIIPLGADNAARSTEDEGEWAFGLVTKWYGGEVYLEYEEDSKTGISVLPYGIPYCFSWIAVTKPNEDEPWVEFEPHGLVFTSAQTAQISYKGCELPPGVTPEDLTIWYWNDILNQYEYIGGVNHIEEQYIEYAIDHFSRYIVASEN